MSVSDSGRPAPSAARRSERRGARDVLDPAVVARLAHLDVRARVVVEGFIAGMHRSPFHGFSVEFAEHRPYMPGDPLKNLDWKVWARSDRLLVKQYTEETNLRCHLVLDLSGSMGFRSKRAAMSNSRKRSGRCSSRSTRCASCRPEPCARTSTSSCAPSASSSRAVGPGWDRRSTSWRSASSGAGSSCCAPI
ncbi:MAG: DUF58 domain-containing protein [Candidatus Eisenbacteria bacterium]|uniref:DUF58 domain-containing protein n=1 Tax=Eiseniibacteriota bacterium TaxID=2212470 RepID=A0A538UBW0_UNCEI|nr:MAG: DUF58 domain-containing protein [Candidatus Eisenbacteria bacterium]